MQQKIRLELKIARQTEQTFNFVTDFYRLIMENKNFILSRKAGKKLYLDTCNGIQKNAYICLADPINMNIVSVINYAIAQKVIIDISLTLTKVVFIITSDDCTKLKFIRNMKNCLGV